jgi:hypothetical protein
MDDKPTVATEPLLQGLPAIVNIRRVSVSDELRRNINQNREPAKESLRYKNLDDFFEDKRQIQCERSESVASVSKNEECRRELYTSSALSPFLEIRAPSYSVPRNHVRHYSSPAQQSMHLRLQGRVADFSGYSDGMGMKDEYMPKKAISAENDDYWLDALREGVDLLSALQMVDRGEIRYQDQEG